MDRYESLDEEYVELDRGQIRRTRNIKLIPTVSNRRGGKRSYAEWAHVIGIFQTLLFLNCRKHSGNTVVDLGSGTGILAIAAEPLVSDGGRYIGLDVNPSDIDFCLQHYPSPPFEFHHLCAHNAAYASEQEGQQQWPVEKESADIITALSVWSHLSEKDAIFNLQETARVLRKGGKAIITAFILDDSYKPENCTSNAIGAYHSTPKNLWLFEKPAYDSLDWFTTEWAQVPEKAIAFNLRGLQRMLTETNLRLTSFHSGCWKEKPGVFFQDILILEKD